LIAKCLGSLVAAHNADFFFLFTAEMAETYLVLYRQVSSGLCLNSFQINSVKLVSEVCVITKKLEEQFPLSPVRCITWDCARHVTFLNPRFPNGWLLSSPDVFRFD